LGFSTLAHCASVSAKTLTSGVIRLFAQVNALEAAYRAERVRLRADLDLIIERLAPGYDGRRISQQPASRQGQHTGQPSGAPPGTSRGLTPVKTLSDGSGGYTG
jgi:hypothetical protein